MSDDWETPLTKAQANFAVQLLKEIVGNDRSIVMSPFSVFYALAMCAEGAAENTLKQIRKCLTGGETLTDTCDDFLRPLKRYAEASGSEAAFTWNCANMAYFKSDIVLKPEFESRLCEHYHCQLGSITNIPAAVKEINARVCEVTRGKIPTVVDSDLLGSAKAVIINAIYFKAKWENLFNKKATRQENFYKDHGAPTRVFMMEQTNSFRHYVGDHMEVLVMKYRGCDISCAILLPRKKCNLSEVLAQMEGDELLGRIKLATTKKIRVIIPKFKFETEKELSGALRNLGIVDAFGKDADFSEMAVNGRQLYIDSVFQKATIEVDEEGTVATAATRVSCRLKCARLPPPVPVFRADHPFLYCIIDVHGTILFLGVYRG